jgi:hypothetical protein
MSDEGGHRRERTGQAVAALLALLVAAIVVVGGLPSVAAADGGDTPRPSAGLAGTADLRDLPSVFGAGDAHDFGSTGTTLLSGPLRDLARTGDGQGYWLLGSDGGVFTYGDAGFFGSTGGIRLNKPAVAMAATSSGQGYWFVASDGGQGDDLLVAPGEGEEVLGGEEGVVGAREGLGAAGAAGPRPPRRLPPAARAAGPPPPARPPPPPPRTTRRAESSPAQ